METFQFLHCITLLDNVAIPCNNRLWHYFFSTKLSLSKWIDNLLSKNYLQMLVYVISIKLSNISHCVRSVQIRENTDQKNTVFGHFLRSVGATGSLPFWRNFSRPPGLPIFASDIASKQSKKIQKNPFSKKYFSVNRITPSNGGSRMRKYWIEHHCIWFRDFYHTVAVTINQQA